MSAALFEKVRVIEEEIIQKLKEEIEALKVRLAELEAKKTLTLPKK